MKRAMITVKQGDITLKVPADTVAQTFISAVLSQIGTSQPAANQGDVPSFGEYWLGEGGYNGGLFQGGDGPYYLIVSKETLKAAYGGYGHKTEGADSPWDGLANTAALLADSVDHPAANLCAGFSADGHTDFYLAARRENQVLEANVGHLFDKDYHLSSTQYSAYHAYIMVFEDGWQDLNGKVSERLVRPVRRKFI